MQQAPRQVSRPASSGRLQGGTPPDALPDPPDVTLQAQQKRRRFQRRLVELEPQFLPLLITVLLPVLLLPATVATTGPLRWLLPLMLTGLVLQSLRALPAVSRSRLSRLVASVHQLLGGLAIAAMWPLTLLENQASLRLLRFLVLLLMGVFSLLASIKLVVLLARVPRVNARVMAGAAAGYIYLGLTGGLVAAALQLLVPGTFFLGPTGGHELLVDRLTYFSFVVLTGLGLGDVLPHNALGERFVILLGLSGTLYLALLLGLLIGRYIATQEVELELDALADAVEDGEIPVASVLVSEGQQERPETERCSGRE